MDYAKEAYAVCPLAPHGHDVKHAMLCCARIEKALREAAAEAYENVANKIEGRSRGIGSFKFKRGLLGLAAALRADAGPGRKG